MSGWNGYSSGSDEHEPSEDRGQAAWGAQGQGSSPPWASAETQTSHAPPPWASAQARPEMTPPWAAPPPQTGGTPYPPPPPTYVPLPPPPGPRRLLVILTAMAVLGSGIGAGVWFLTRDGSTSPGATPGTSVAVTTSPPSTPPAEITTPASTPPVSPLESPPPTPATGYRSVEDPVGYTLFVPEDWIRRQKEGEKAPVVYYDAPADGRQLQIFRLSEDSPADSLRLAENDPGYGFARQRGYQALERDEGETWSELTYRYDDEDKGARRVVDHRFEAADGEFYAIRASGPETTSAAQIREPLTAALGSFCPATGTCL
ncbi:hypothetical protein [Streptomyces sp. WM6386]|uniref:hypothetical protein n=1 Tax=Streptomyces sp. WM6386 TaxID=1415558 RepID=UPI0006196C2C|nr:hypothetical protein [Streptomyces sp. WM6386]KKD04669.1 hypothetical protein TN53_28415 [Streptomyces sp. WM6386]